MEPGPRSSSSVGFTVGDLVPEPEPEPEQEPVRVPVPVPVPAVGSVTALNEGEGDYDAAGYEDEEEYDSEDWYFDEDYWSDEDDGAGFRRRSLRSKVKVPSVLKKRSKQKKHREIMAADGVQWQPNKSTKVCQQCEKKFTIKVRRHHCRRCGGIFCASCSAKSLAREGQVAEPMRACDTCVAEVEVQPMFAWLSRRRAIPKTVEEVRSALQKVLQFSTNAKMQSWLLSPYTHICEGGRLIPKPADLDVSQLQIQQCLPSGAERPAEATLLAWAGALLFLDERLLELRNQAVPEIPEVVFWQRYFGQIYRAIQYAMSQQRWQQQRGTQLTGADGPGSAATIVVDHDAIATSVRRAVVAENDSGAALNNVLTRVYQQAGAAALERAVNTVVAVSQGPRESEQQQQGRGLTVLHWAAMIGDPGKCAVLLRHGVSAQARTAQHGITPLIIAATTGKAAVVELLLKAAKPKDADQQHPADQSQEREPAVDVNATTQGGVSAVQMSDFSGHDAVSALLRSAGADAMVGGSAAAVLEIVAAIESFRAASTNVNAAGATSTPSSTDDDSLDVHGQQTQHFHRQVSSRASVAMPVQHGTTATMSQRPTSPPAIAQPHYQ